MLSQVRLSIIQSIDADVFCFLPYGLDEIKVTITLNSPARLNYSYTKDTANQNIVVFRTPAGDTLRVIKKTLIDRARVSTILYFW